MESLINNIGGYDSLLFALLSLGCSIVGIIALYFTVFILPVPLFGCLLLFSWLTYEATTAYEATDFGVVTIIPILFLIGELLVVAIIFEGSLRRRKKTKGNNLSKSPQQ